MNEIILLAIISTIILALLWWWSKSRLVLVTTLLYGCYALYEYWLLDNCPGECNIRVDLLIIWPVLVMLALLSLGQCILQLVKPKK